MKTTYLLKAALLAMPLMLASCHSKKTITESTQSTPVATSYDASQKTFLQKVADNAQTTKFITSKVKFSVEYGTQTITLTGNLKMKRNDVIQVQLMAFGFVEAARLEFTQDYVLIMDRINKHYLKAPYAHIDFLRNSGLNFYSLQALFWNELFQPNRTTLTEDDYKRFTSSGGDDDVVISLEDNKMNYSWLANNKSGIIKMANILYKDRFNGNSQLNWDYEAFQKQEDTKKLFPTNMAIALNTNEKEVKVGIKLNYINHETEWETRTPISNKYREVTIDDILRRFMAL